MLRESARKTPNGRTALNHRGRTLAVWCLACLSLAPATPSSAAPVFQLDRDRLTVQTDTLELVLQQGAIVTLRDLGTGEFFSLGDLRASVSAVPTGVTSASDGWAFRQAWYKGGPDYCAAQEKLQAPRHRPVPGAAPALTQLSPAEVELVYITLGGGEKGDEIRYRVAVDADTQDVLLTGTARLADPEAPPQSLDFAFLNLKCPAVVLGCGTRIAATVPERRVDYCTRAANNLHSPQIAVLEGRNGAAACFPEAFTANVNTFLVHTPDADDAVVFQTGRDSRHESSVIRSVPLRVGVYSSWVMAARRYRERFEALTGAKPLWEQTPAWVRKIHAVHTGAPGGNHGDPPAEEAKAYYKNLADLVAPESLLLFYWNGNGIVLFGDHRYMTRLGWPKPHVVDALKTQGFRWLGYHPYTLLFPPHAIAQRYQEIEERNWGMPEGYVFTPDYDGPPETFHDHFRPVSTGYYKPMDEARLWVCHPGARLGREYFLRNFGNYCRFHRMDGSYLDTCGADGGHHFPDGKWVFEGMTYRLGEDRMLLDVKKQLPDLACMSEVQSTWSVARTFYTWEGASHYTHARTYASNDSIVNHPLRTALWGSYCWTRESVLGPEESALMGALPELHLDDPWSIARCRLFTDEELFSDLPDAWDPEALACYRAKGERWFQFRRLPCGDGYVELTAKRFKVRLGRFAGVWESPLEERTRIPGWQAYRDGRPIGLNPKRTYPFLTETSEDAEADYTLTALPAGTFVRACRNDAKAWSTVEFGATGSEIRHGEVSITFGRDCLRVCDVHGEHVGPFTAGTQATFATRIPGGLVLVWQEPAPHRGHRRNALLQASGKLDARGVHDPRWCYQSHCRVVRHSIGEVERAAIEVGSARHRGYAESWVVLEPDGDPVLRFEVGYPRPKGHRAIRTHAFCVHVNGCEVWREHVDTGADWLPRLVPLGLFKGRTVLLTLSVEELTSQDVGPSHLDPPSLFGNVHVDRNPISFAPLDGLDLPRPAEVLFTDFADATQVAADWTMVNSSANQGEALQPTIENGMLSLPGSHYKHQYLTRPLPEPNPVVQARLQMALTGTSRAWNAGIGLYWSKGQYCFITAGGYRNNDTGFTIRGTGRRTVTLDGRTMRILDDNTCDCWVRIEVEPKTIRYAASLDGRSWTTEVEISRPPSLAGPPRLLIVGRGDEGEGDVFRNDLHHNIPSIPARIGQLVVGRSDGK